MSTFEPYKTAIRNQFTYYADDKTNVCLLTKNVKLNSDINVNIVGMFATKIPTKNKKCNLVRIVVGTNDPSTPENQQQNEQFQDNLEHLGINFEKHSIIQIFNVAVVLGTPGTYRIPYTKLVCAGINILATYTGEPTTNEILSHFFEVNENQIGKAVQLISSIDTTNPDAELCINRSNVDAKCERCSGKNCGRQTANSDTKCKRCSGKNCE